MHHRNETETGYLILQMDPTKKENITLAEKSQLQWQDIHGKWLTL